MKRPNILYIFADQMRYTALPSNGNTVVKTPNFDKLAEQGMSFDRAFSSCPICSPYRAQVLSGLYSHQNGTMDNEYKMRTDIDTLPKALKRAGYNTGYVGKWHLGYGPYTEDKRYGFDYMAAYNLNHDYLNGSYHENESGPIKMEKWGPEAETDLAIDFMEKHVNKASDEPFALMLAWGPPHFPYEKYPQEYNIYNPADVDINPNVPKEAEETARKEIAHYYGNITAIDVLMGKVMQTLDRLGIADNTILCFTSDHGDHLRCHGYTRCNDKNVHHSLSASKATPYDESIHIPFILRWPEKVGAETRTDVFFNSVDVFPTLLGMCGVEPSKGLAGKDLSEAILYGKSEKPDSVYLQILGEGWPHRGKWVGFWRGVRTEQYVYARWLENEHEPVLFDVVNDPFEMNNLYGKPEYKDVTEALEARLKQWMRDTNDPFETGARDSETGMLLLNQEFTDEKWLKK